MARHLTRRTDDALTLDPTALRLLLRPGDDGQVSLLDFVDALATLARQSGRDLDFAAAGILTQRAYATLAEESHAALERHQDAAPAPPLSDPEDPWGPLTTYLDTLDPGARFTRHLLHDDTPAPHPGGRRRPLPRRASLDELLRALHEAEEEARARLAEDRPDRRAEREARARASVQADDPTAELARVRARLPPPGETVPLRALADGCGAGAWVAALQAVLHLRFEGVIVFEQERIGAPIHVRRARRNCS